MFAPSSRRGSFSLDSPLYRTPLPEKWKSGSNHMSGYATYQELAQSAMLLCSDPVRLNKDRRFIFRFASAGFLIAALAASCILFNAPNIFTNLSILFLPGTWSFLPKIYVKV